METANILIVEDEKIVAMEISRKLKQLGYSIAGSVDSGEKAVQKAWELNPDLILMDIRMPGKIDGIQAAEEIKHLNIPVIFLTAYADNETLRRAKITEAYGYVLKPFQTKTLHIAIEMALYKSKTEVQLKESEEKYRVLFQNIGDPVFIVDQATHKILDWNPAVVRVYGFTAVDLKDMKFSDLPVEKIPSDDKIEKKLLKLEDPIPCQHKLKNGKIIDVEIRSTETSYHNQKVWIHMVRDVTERIKIELAIKKQIAQNTLLYQVGQRVSKELKSETLLPEIVESIYSAFDFFGVMLFILDEDEKKLVLKAISGGYVKVFPDNLSVSVGEGMIGKAVETCRLQISNDVKKNPFYVRKAGEKTKSELSVPIKSRDKVIGVIDIQSNALNAFNDDDVKTMETLSSQIASAIENARLYESAQRAMAELDQIFNDSIDGMRVIDKNFRMLRVNDTFLKMTGLTKEEVLGKRCYEVFHSSVCHTLDCPMFQIKGHDSNVQCEVVRSNSSYINSHYVLTATAFKSEKGVLIGIVENLRDITQQKALETQLVQAQKLESIGQLAAGISHEINTPMQYVGDNTRFFQESFQDLSSLLKAYNELFEAVISDKVTSGLSAKVKDALKDADLDYLQKEIPKAIEQSLEGIERINRIVRSMKEFSHPATQEKTAIDINQAIESTITISRNEWKYVSGLDTHFDPGLPLVKCLPGEFNQVILNLIINAAHAIGDLVKEGLMEKGKITVSTGLLEENRVEIRIQDNGKGIPEDIQTKIFNPFFTTKEVGKGTGQGLAIAYNVIVEKHKGKISVESEVGKGTTFIIEVPVNGQK